MAWDYVHSLAYQGCGEELGALLEADPQLLQAEDQFGWDVLAFAANGGHESLVRWLVAHGADPLHRDREGHTAAYHAAASGQLAALRALIESGGCPSDDVGPVIAAASNGHAAPIVALAAAGVRVDVAPTHTHTHAHAPLWHALRGGHLRAARALVQAGARADEHALAQLLLWSAHASAAGTTNTRLPPPSDPPPFTAYYRNTNPGPCSWAEWRAEHGGIADDQLGDQPLVLSGLEGAILSTHAPTC